MKYLLFDMDGVLLDSEIGAFAVFQKTANRLGIGITLEELLKTYVGTRTRKIVEDLIRRYEVPITVDEFLEERAKDGSFYETSDEVKPFEGEVAFLEYLKEQGIRMAVVSSTESRKVLTALNRMNILQYFDIVVCGDTLKAGKPDPEGYLKAMEYLGAEKEECLILEDSPTGIQAAINAGVRVIGLKQSKLSQDTSKADAEVSNYDNLKKLFINHNIL